MGGGGQAGDGSARHLRAAERHWRYNERGICGQQRGIGAGLARHWGLSGKAPARDRRAAAMGLGESEEADPAAGD